MVNKDGGVYAIDHGCTFCYGDDSRDFDSYYRFVDQNQVIPRDVTEKIEQFLSWEEGEKILGDLLAELLPENEAKACIARIKNVGKLLKKKEVHSLQSSDFNPK